jgi:hypothetical protein
MDSRPGPSRRERHRDQHEPLAPAYGSGKDKPFLSFLRGGFFNHSNWNEAMKIKVRMPGVRLSYRSCSVVGVALLLLFGILLPEAVGAASAAPGKPAAKPSVEAAPAPKATPQPTAKVAEKATDQAAGTPIIDPQVNKLLREMGEYLKNAQQFSFQAEITFDDLLPSGQKIQFGATQDVAVRRPNRAYFEYRGDLGTKRFWYNGDTITLYDPGANLYASEKVPATIDEATDATMKDFGFSPPLADLLSADPYKVLIKKVQFGINVGMSMIDGIRCYHLAFMEQYIDWQIWIEDGKQLVPRKILITYKTIPGAPQFTAVLSDWDFATRLPDGLFTATLPVTAEKIEFGNLAKNVQKKE